MWKIIVLACLLVAIGIAVGVLPKKIRARKRESERENLRGYFLLEFPERSGVWQPLLDKTLDADFDHPLKVSEKILWALQK